MKEEKEGNEISLQDDPIKEEDVKKEDIETVSLRDNKEADIQQAIVDEAMDLMLKVDEHFDVSRVDGRKIYLKYTDTNVNCPICEKVHDKGEPRLHLTEDNMIYFNCGRKPLNKKELLIGKSMRAEEIKKKEGSSMCLVS